MSDAIESEQFRRVLGQYPTGVTVITGLSEQGDPLGMTVGSFCSVSLDPPLVAFMPDKRSSSWAMLRDSGERFCVNILSIEQERVCRAVATRKQDKFAGIAWTHSPRRCPVIDGSIAYLDCVREEIVDAGDHQIVVGRVLGLEHINKAVPLLFFQGGYGGFNPSTLVASSSDLLAQLPLVDVVRPEMERLSIRFGTEVSAMALTGSHLALIATVGRSAGRLLPTRVGERVPFGAPIGGTFVAWADSATQRHWLERTVPIAGAGQVERWRQSLAEIRGRGFSLNIGHDLGRQFEGMVRDVVSQESADGDSRLIEFYREMGDDYNPEALGDGDYEFRAATAPVFKDSRVVFSITLWGPEGEVSRAEIDRSCAELVQATRAMGEAIAHL